MGPLLFFLSPSFICPDVCRRQETSAVSYRLHLVGSCQCHVEDATVLWSKGGQEEIAVALGEGRGGESLANSWAIQYFLAIVCCKEPWARGCV